MVGSFVVGISMFIPPVWATYMKFTTYIFDYDQKAFWFFFLFPVPVMLAAQTVYNFAKDSEIEGLTRIQVQRKLSDFLLKLALYALLESFMWAAIFLIFPILLHRYGARMLILDAGGFFVFAFTSYWLYNIGSKLKVPEAKTKKKRKKRKKGAKQKSEGEPGKQTKPQAKQPQQEKPKNQAKEQKAGAQQEKQER